MFQKDPSNPSSSHTVLYHEADWVSDPPADDADTHYLLADNILRAYRRHEAFDVLVHGAKGRGKSGYLLKVGREIYGKEYRRWVVFPPTQFLEVFEELYATGGRIPFLDWEDAGVWLYAMDYHDPRVTSVVKLLNVNRETVSCVGLNAPSDEMIVRKLRTIEGMLQGTPRKPNPEYRWTREIDFYLYSKGANNRRYPHYQFSDRFDVRLPRDDLNWYLPRRRAYLKAALALAQDAYQKDERYLALMQVAEAELARQPTLDLQARV